MDEPTADLDRRFTRRALVALFLFALAVRLIVIARSEVAARDSIGFVRDALLLERGPVVAVLRGMEHPPGYPLAVLITSWPVRAVIGTGEASMVLSAQLASAAFGALLVFPMYRVGRELFGRYAGLLAAALFQTFPGWIKFTSDGLSESTFLFWGCTALALGLRAMREPGLRRPGGVRRRRRAGVSDPAGRGGDRRGGRLRLGVVAMAAGSAVRVEVGRRAGGGAGVRLSRGRRAIRGHDRKVDEQEHRQANDRRSDGDAFAFAVDAGRTAGRRRGRALGRLVGRDRAVRPARFGWVAQAIGREWLQGMNYVGAVLAGLGLVWLGPLLRNRPGGWAIAALAGCHAAVLWRMAMVIGYVSERHTLLLVFAGCLPAAAALRLLSPPRFAPAVALAGLFLTGLPSLAKPLHGNRAGHRAAGEWIAAHGPSDLGVLDPFGWANFYSGRVLGPNPTAPRELFVIVEGGKNPHSRLPVFELAKAKAAEGELVYHWPPELPSRHAKVLVYRCPAGPPKGS